MKKMNCLLNVTRMLGLVCALSLAACSSTRQQASIAPVELQEASTGLASAAQTSAQSAQQQATQGEEPELLASTAATSAPQMSKQEMQQKIAQAREALANNKEVKSKMSWTSRVLLNQTLKKVGRKLEKQEVSKVKKEEATHGSSLNQMATIGLILAAVGLVLVLVAGGGAYTLGVLLLVVGLVLLLVGLLS